MSKRDQAGIYNIVAFVFDGQKAAGENLKVAKKNHFDPLLQVWVQEPLGWNK